MHNLAVVEAHSRVFYTGLVPGLRNCCHPHRGQERGSRQ